MDYFEQSRIVGQFTAGPMKHAVVPSYPQPAFSGFMMELLADEWLLLQAMYWRWGEGIIEQQRQFIGFEFGCTATAGVADLQKTLSVASKVRKAMILGFFFFF